jgi:hypothetical protein
MTNTSQLTHEQVAEIAQEHEDFLNQLESLAISAIATGNWYPLLDLVSEVETWQAEQDLLAQKSHVEDPLKELWAICASQQRFAIAFPKASTEVLSRPGAGSFSSANNQLEKD